MNEPELLGMPRDPELVDPAAAISRGVQLADRMNAGDLARALYLFALAVQAARTRVRSTENCEREATAAYNIAALLQLCGLPRVAVPYMGK
jgi:hypothetical protein